MHYLNYNGAKKIWFQIYEQDLFYEWTIECEEIYVQQLSVDKLRKLLSIQRQSEIEEAYGIPNAEFGNCHELSIVGMSIDFADVVVKDGSLCIKMIRNKNFEH